MVSAYGKTGGWNKVTENVLLTIERNLTLQGARPPFIIVGDFNCEPAIMENKGCLKEWVRQLWPARRPAARFVEGRNREK